MNSFNGIPSITLWDAVLENGSLRCLRSEVRWKDFYYQARIEQQESDGGWKKIGLLDSKIHIDWPNYWPKEEATRIFLEDRLVAAIETQTDRRILTVDGVGTWRFDETEDTRIFGIESGLPAICLKTVSGVYWRGGLPTTIQDAVSGVEIARFREIPPRLFQSFGSPEVFAHPAMRPLVATAALRKCVIDSLDRACATDG